MRAKFREAINKINNPELMKIIYIPGLLFILDSVLRAVIGLDLIDAGADMALLAVSTAFSLLVEKSNEKSRFTFLLSAFFLIFMIIWIICLRITSLTNEILLSWFRLLLTWTIGITAFVISSLVTDMVVNDSDSTPAME